MNILFELTKKRKDFHVLFAILSKLEKNYYERPKSTTVCFVPMPSRGGLNFLSEPIFVNGQVFVQLS